MNRLNRTKWPLRGRRPWKQDGTRQRRFNRYRVWWDSLCRLGSRLSELGAEADPASREAVEKQYAETLAEIRRLQAA